MKEKVEKLYKKGLPQSEIARRLRVSRQRVWTILRNPVPLKNIFFEPKDVFLGSEENSPEKKK